MTAIVQRGLEVARALDPERVMAFAVALALPLVLALNGGGYDAVIRSEVGLVVWCAIGLGLAFGVLPRSRLSPAVIAAAGGLAGLAGLTLLAHLWTESDERTTAELARALQYLGVVTLAYLGLNRSTWQSAGAGLACAALLLPFLAVASRLYPDVLTDDTARLLATDRLSFPLDYWNAVACWGAMAAAIGIAWSAHAPRPEVRAAACAAVPPAALAVYLTYSRAGVVAVALAVIAAVALSRFRITAVANGSAAMAASSVPILAARSQDEIARGTGADGAALVLLALAVAMAASAAVAAYTWRSEFDRFWIPRERARPRLIALVVCLGVAAIALNGPIQDRWHEFKEEPSIESSVDPTQRLGSFGGTRYSIWSDAIDAFAEDPVSGLGPGTFEFHWNREGEGDRFIRDAHSLYLELLAELGLPGLALLLVFFGGALVAGFEARRGWRPSDELGIGIGLLAGFIVFAFYAGVDWVWEVGAVGVLALGGIATVGASSLPRARPAEFAAPLRFALVLIALVAAAAQVPSLISVERVRESDRELTAKDPAAAIAAADDAIAAEPWGASGYASRALAERAAGEQDRALDDVNEAIEREPTNWRHRLLLAELEAAAGNLRETEQALLDARRLSPRLPLLAPGSAYTRALQRSADGAGR